MDYKELNSKYGYFTGMLMMHYAAVAGELPTELINILGINTQNRQYVFYHSKLKGMFICYRQNHMNGYQLRGSGIDYLEANHLERYNKFITSASYSRRRTTKNPRKRRRFQNAAFMFYFFDILDIDYLEKSESTYFIPACVLKQEFLLSDSETENLNREAHQFKSSKTMGLLVNGRCIYNTYVFMDGISALEKSTEYRAVENINARYRYELGKTEAPVKTLVLTRNTDTQILIAKRIMEIKRLIQPCKKDDNSKLVFFRDFDFDLFDEFYVISMDVNGEKEMRLLLQRETTERTLLKQLNQYNKEPIHKLGIACDCYISDRPAIFLYALDIIKLIQFFNSLTIRGLQGYIFCLPHHVEIVRELFFKHQKSVAIIALEM